MMHHICMRNLLDMKLALRNGISLWAGPQSHTQLSENGMILNPSLRSVLRNSFAVSRIIY